MMNTGFGISSWLTIAATLAIALLLTLLPLPAWAAPFRPAWLLLVTLYWAIALPHRIGIITAWGCGLLLDVLQGTLLGENALGFIIVIYLAVKMHRQIRLFNLPAQAGCIFLLLLLNQFLLFWLQGLQGQSVSPKWFWGCPLISACLWPWLYLVLTDCLRRYRLH